MKVYVLYSYPITGDKLTERQIIDLYFNAQHAQQDATYYNSVAAEEDDEIRYDYFEMDILNNPRSRGIQV